LTGGVIKGWQEALPLMKPGAKWQLFIPPDLAYGNTERPIQHHPTLFGWLLPH
jgi:FKBP-type peptidyl-prolyl cis-trans isomerase